MNVKTTLAKQTQLLTIQEDLICVLCMSYACYRGYSGVGFNRTCMLLTSYPAYIDNTEDLHSF